MIPKKLKEHPIWSKVVASIVTAAILYGATFIPGFYRAAWNGIKAAGQWLIASTSVANWLLIALSILALSTIFWIAARLRNHPESYPSVTEEFETVETGSDQGKKPPIEA